MVLYREIVSSPWQPMEVAMHQPGFPDFNIRLHRIDKAGDPLTKLNQAIDWEQFRPI